MDMDSSGSESDDYAKRENKRMRERGDDTGIALGGDREVPHFAHNSWRRMADSAAQACFAAGKCDKEDVDLHFGWKLRKYAKEMRLHYADRGARASRARITEMI